MNKIAVIAVSNKGLETAQIISRELYNSQIFSKTDIEGTNKIDSYEDFIKENFNNFSAFIFIGALGICVRYISGLMSDKYKDPAVVCVDSNGKYVISVLSGHVGGGNELTKQVAAIVGGEAVITTQSDVEELWSLDTMAKKYGWVQETDKDKMNKAIFSFVNKEKTALLLEIRTKETDELERTKPDHVDIYYNISDIELYTYKLLIIVSYKTDCIEFENKINYYPKVLHLGCGCKKDCASSGATEHIKQTLISNNISPLSITSLSTIELKKDEPFMADVVSELGLERLGVYTSKELESIEVSNPSEKVFNVTGVWGVAESCAIKASNGGKLVLEKQKAVITDGDNFTFAVAATNGVLRTEGHIEIVGAGPGDPELISVRGKNMLQRADLILYAGSLVPRELTLYAKGGATVRSSADMTLEEQFEIMYSFYRQGKFIVRLHTGDPCIYGAIAEQMAFFDKYGMSYHITPGISSFQAAAAALKSQFTIPEQVQSIILTRGEGRTPMPEKEKLHMLARSQSTMCIYLSASIADKVQEELLQAYSPETPVAVCYKLTWKEEKIYRGQLNNLAKIVKDNNLTLTTMIVVGDAIDHREGLSRLYSHEFKHLFRK